MWVKSRRHYAKRNKAGRKTVLQSGLQEYLKDSQRLEREGTVPVDRPGEEAGSLFCGCWVSGSQMTSFLQKREVAVT